jgi:HIRAN domain/HipA N-terminal domain
MEQRAYLRITMNALYLAWREPDHRWWPVGQLSYAEQEYRFTYTKGALEATKAGFLPIPSFPELGEVYVSGELFPLFANRLPPKRRPDYKDFIEWLDIKSDESDPMALLASSGGRRETDMFEVFRIPKKNATGHYESSFFVRGLGHQAPNVEKEASQLHLDDSLELREERNNPHDPHAVQVLVSQSGTRIGYVPRYLCDDIHILKERNSDQLDVRVKRVNPTPIPAQFRVLCTLKSAWPEGFYPFSGPQFEPLHK